MENYCFHVDEPFKQRSNEGCEKFKRRDKLNVGEFIKNLSDLIKARDGVLGLVAPYGSGKSFILNYLYCYLTEELHENVIYIDISKFEYDKNILRTILVNILRETRIRGAFRDLARRLLPKVSKHFLSKVLGLNEEFFKDLAEDSAETILKMFDEEEELKREIESVAKSMRLTIIIDNIDRCRPDFFLYFLSYIKEILSIPNLLFIIAYDKKQIVNFIKSSYGERIDEQNFLKKYIPIDIHLPDYKLEDIKKFLNYYFSEGLKELLKEFDVIEIAISFLAQAYEGLMPISLRKLEIICKKLNNQEQILFKIKEEFKKNPEEAGEKYGDLKILFLALVFILVIEQVDYNIFYRLKFWNLHDNEFKSLNDDFATFFKEKFLRNPNIKYLFQLILNEFAKDKKEEDVLSKLSSKIIQDNPDISNKDLEFFREVFKKVIDNFNI